MIPVGRPFLDYILSALADGGIEEVCTIVAPGDGPIRRRYERDVRTQRLRIAFAEQAAPRGTADAILTARSFAGNDDFLVLNADNLYTPVAIRQIGARGGFAIAAYRAASLMGKGNIPRERLRAYATIEAGDDGHLSRVIEKPGDKALIDDDTLISMNLWAFGTAVFNACARVTPSTRGELELASAIQLLIADGVRFRVVRLDEGVLDLTERRDIATVTERLRDVTVQL